MELSLLGKIFTSPESGVDFSFYGMVLIDLPAPAGGGGSRWLDVQGARILGQLGLTVTPYYYRRY